MCCRYTKHYGEHAAYSPMLLLAYLLGVVWLEVSCRSIDDKVDILAVHARILYRP